MEIRADFTERVLVQSDELDWVASPVKGVERRMLDRIGDEVARATTIVKYAPGSQFTPHSHGGGEEFIVLEGVFEDEYGAFPAGSYIRNPPTSSHKPGSGPGCVIFVKLWQFDPADRTPVKVNMNKMGAVAVAGRPGVAVTSLFEDLRETVQLESWRPNALVEIDVPEGAEILVLDGTAKTDRAERLRKGSWLRLPLGASLRARAGKDGTKVWVKTRHLRFVEAPQALRRA